MTTTTDLIKQLQTTYFEMRLKGFITEEEFNVLGNITEEMEKNEHALSVLLNITPWDLDDEDLIDCILAREFKAAVTILC